MYLNTLQEMQMIISTMRHQLRANKKFQEDWKEERDAIRKLQSEKKPVEGFEDYFKAAEEAEFVLRKMDETELEVSLNPVKMDKFVAAVSEEEISFEQIAILLDGGILEE